METNTIDENMGQTEPKKKNFGFCDILAEFYLLMCYNRNKKSNY